MARVNTRNMQEQKVLFRAQCEADGSEGRPCWMCGMPIDYEAEWDDWENDDRYQLDHYWPVSTHPELQEDPANFRPSHAGCNLERSNRAPQPGLGVLSRQWV